MSYQPTRPGRGAPSDHRLEQPITPSVSVRRIALGEQEYQAVYDATGRLMAERWVTRACIAEFAPQVSEPPPLVLSDSDVRGNAPSDSGFLATLATFVTAILCAALALGLLGLGAFAGLVIGGARGAAVGFLLALFILGWLLAPGDAER